MTVQALHENDQPNEVKQMVGTNPTQAMALNLAAWTDVSVRCLGVEAFRTPTLWGRRPGGSGIYLGAVICDGAAPHEAILADLRKVQEAWGGKGISVYDCWATYDLSALGLVRQVKNPWYLRNPAPLPTIAPPSGLAIEIVRNADTLAEFERASVVGFGESEAALEGHAPFDWHAPATLNDPGMYYLVARLDSQVVAGVIAYATSDMMGIYGISTLSDYRRRGYASALMRVAATLRPELPLSVFPDPDSLPIYSNIGFIQAGEIAIWGA